MQPIRLLIADDNADLRQRTHDMVAIADDIQVVSLAADGQEALEMARQHLPDVAVIDVHMPRMDGLTAIKRLASISPATACMAMSYDGEHEMLRQAMAAGAREYLIKPFNGDEFVTAIRRVAGRREPPARKADRSEATEEERTREQELIKVAVSYLRSGRTDAEAAQSYAQLVRLPNLDTPTLTRLAEIFLAQRDWSTLRLICERLEKSPANSNHKFGP